MFNVKIGGHLGGHLKFKIVHMEHAIDFKLSILRLFTLNMLLIIFAPLDFILFSKKIH